MGTVPSLDAGRGRLKHGQIGSICAVVLTYNRRALARDCLKAIERQTHGCRDVIVVDNASTDGTFAMLQQDFPSVRVARLRSNAGAAGGFNVGMRLAVATGADHVWIMDDDVIPEKDALAQLVQALSTTRAEGRDPPFVISTARDPTGCLTNVPILDREQNQLRYPNWADYLHKALLPVTSASFVSILIPRRVFEHYGFPHSSMYIWGEDFEFTKRITKKEAGFMCGLSRVQHVRAIAGNLNIRTESNPLRLQWHRLLVRNRIFRLRCHGSRRELVWQLVADGKRALKLLSGGDLKRASLTASGILAGLNFHPSQDPELDEALFEYVTPGLQACLIQEPQRAPDTCEDDKLKVPGHGVAVS